MQFPLLIAALVILGVDMLYGFGRGLGRTVVRLITMIISAVAAYFAAKTLCRAFENKALDQVQEFLKGNETLATLFADNPDVLTSVSVLAEVLVAPLLFFLCYLVFKLLTFFVYAIICGIFGIGKKKERTFVSRIAGLAVGAVAGVVGVLVLVIPVCGYSDYVNDTLIALRESGIAENAELEEYREGYLAPIADTPGCSTLYGTLGKPVFDGLTTGELDGEKVVLKSETLALLHMAGSAKSLAGKDISTYGEEESAAVREIAAEMGDSVILTHVGSAMLKDLSVRWMAGEPFFGVPRPTINEDADILVNGILAIFSTSNAQNIEGDLTGIADIFSVCIKYDLFACFSTESDGNVMLVRLSNGFLSEVQTILKSAPRMAPISNAISDIGMRYMIDRLGVPGEYAENYPQLMADMASTLRTLYDDQGNVNKEAFSENLSAVLADNGVDIKPEAVDLIANGIAEHFTKEEIETMQDEEIVSELIVRFGSAEEALSAAQKFQNGGAQMPE